MASVLQRVVISMIRLVLLLILALPATAEWRVVREGIEYQRITRTAIDAHVVRVHLRDHELRVVATDRADRGLTVRDYARRTGAVVAVNGDYFTSQMETIGLAAGACGTWAKPRKSRTEPLLATGERRVEIFPEPKTRTWMTGGVSGWPLLVDACAIRSPLPGRDAFTRAPHARTAVGLSKDRETMLLITTAGRGATLPDLAALLSELGACTAFNLDGGSSTAMWLDGSLLPGSANGRVANHLAVVPAADYSGCDKTRRSVTK